jgi:imidazoleglycerol phosphate synthase cyclase subunit
MLGTRIIPCLDLRDGRVVKGVKFSNLRDAGDPVELAKNYELQGADEIVLLDVSATLEGRGAHLRTIQTVREQIGIAITTGGGVREAKDAANLLEAGADKVSVNTAAVLNPELIQNIATSFGSQCAVLAVDAARTADNKAWEVVTHAGTTRTGMDVVDWVKKAVTLGAGEILLTSFDRDGTREGYDLELLRAVSSAVNVPVIASGGASKPEHLIDAIKAGANAVLAASIFHDGDYTVLEIKQELNKAGLKVRL